MDLFHSGRKLRFTSSVYDMYLSAKAECCSRGIHGNVAAAYDSDFLSCYDRSIIAVVKRFHQIASCQVLVGREYAVGVLARDTHEHWKSCSGSDEYSLKSFLFHELIDGCGFTDDNICLKLHTKFFDFLNLFRDNLLLRKTEFRNTVHKHAAQLVERLEYSHVISHLRQISRTGQSCRAGTDDCHLVAVHCLRSYRLDIMLKRVICHESLQLTDRYRLALDPADTLTLTLGLLRADTSADRRKRAGLSNHLICFFDISCLHFADEARDINGYRTSCDTFRILAVNTSCRLFHSLFHIVSEANLLEVRRTYLRVLLSYRHFLQYICHYSSPPQCPQPPWCVSPSMSLSIARPSAVLYVWLLFIAWSKSTR